ncbi:hypothetical protein DV711_04345 [Motiliproteus coralliicola]|uniref:Hydrolase 2, exosortase A system-associated n=1 Tax=Motiliproteus coralliicola TaxID=2283196 RepID=A0A369WTA9_9GAMM|nr:hypothetical protein [Motiliproteus coralliicola]RDE24821.1 hypothetical protein DV711_04345 [Motiliproteus coralliicola]
MSDGYFLATDRGHLYLARFGELAGRHVWLYLPPFAEEMNLSRAIVARQARAFVESGEAVVCLDYLGSGDSELELDQTDLDCWLDNIRAAVIWLQQQGAASVGVWGLRFGALMATTYLEQRGTNGYQPIDRLLLWKPVLDAKTMMGQFFRMRQVADSIKGLPKVNWQERVKQGETVEVAGYPVSTNWLRSISELRMRDQIGLHMPQTIWLEAASDKISPAVDKVAQLWPEAGLTLQYCEGSAFWQNPDCYDSPALIQQTLDSCQELREDVCVQ